MEGFEFRADGIEDLERGRSPRRPGMESFEQGRESVDVGDVRVQGAHSNVFSNREETTFENQMKACAKIMIGSFLILLVAWIVNSAKLKAKAD